MSESQNNNANKLKENFEETAMKMGKFSVAIQALYTDQAVIDSFSDAAEKFRKIRDDTRQDAIVYLKCILPVTTNFISSVKEYLERYEAIPHEDWCEMLSDILDEAKTHEGLAQTVLHLYEDFKIPLRKRQDEVRVVRAEFQDLQSKYQQEYKEYDAKANRGRNRGEALLRIPVVRRWAYPLLTSANEDTRSAVLAKKLSETNKSAAQMIDDTFIPAQSSLNDYLVIAAGFFLVIQQELESFEMRNKKDPSNVIFHRMMTVAMREMKSNCVAFYKVLPTVRVNLAALPTQDTDRYYVDQWLEKTLSDMKDRRKSTQKIFWSLLEGIEGIDRYRPVF